MLSCAGVLICCISATRALFDFFFNRCLIHLSFGILHVQLLLEKNACIPRPIIRSTHNLVLSGTHHLHVGACSSLGRILLLAPALWTSEVSIVRSTNLLGDAASLLWTSVSVKKKFRVIDFWFSRIISKRELKLAPFVAATSVKDRFQKDTLCSSIFWGSHKCLILPFVTWVRYGSLITTNYLLFDTSTRFNVETNVGQSTSITTDIIYHF